MNKIIFFLITSVLFSCNNANKQNDSVDSANDANKSNDSAKYSNTNVDSTAPDETFLVKAYSGGMMEVMLGKMAQQNAASQQVKQFGEMMITDHTKADSELVALAKEKNIVLPSAPSNDMYEKINKLQSKTGSGFDKDYTSLMIDDHKEDIEEFKKATHDAKDPDVVAFAQKTIPVLQKHLAAIQQIDKTMKK